MIPGGFAVGMVPSTRGGTSSRHANLVASGGAAQTVDLSLGDYWRIVLDANITITLPPVVNPGEFYLELVQDGTGGRTVTWADTIRWSGDLAPTLNLAAGKADLLAFVTPGASKNWRGGLSVAGFTTT